MLKILLLGLFAFAAAEKITFNDYKVFRIMPTHESQVEFLRMLSDSDEYNFWNSPTYANRSVDVMVSPQQMTEFHELMETMKAEYSTHIDDVQDLIDNENVYLAHTSDYHSRYHQLAEIYDYLDKVAKEHPDKVKVVVGGRSYEGRQIKGVKVTFKKSNPGVFIEGGIHAREWISSATVTYILDQLLNSKNPEVRSLAERHNWFIFPVFNPDGYEFTHKKNRLWRKTRKPYGLCYGADPNRNFAYKWREGGASSNPCSETYAGIRANSEIEIQTISRFIESVQNEFYAYISFHSYSQLLLFPYGHTTAHLENYDDLYAIGTKSIKALAQRYDTQYIIGNVAEAIYVATGSSVDWVKGVLRKPICYTYELRDQGRYGFLLPPEQIIPTGEETLDSLVAMFKEAANRKYPQ